VRFPRSYTFGALAVVGALAYAVEIGPFWLTDAFALALAACAVGYFAALGPPAIGDLETATTMLYYMIGQSQGNRNYMMLRHKDAAPERDQAPGLRRSRIAHYVIVSKSMSTAYFARQSDSPFERALLSHQGWRTITDDGLEAVIWEAPLTQKASP